MVCIFDPACELLPPVDGEELYLCTVLLSVAPLMYLLSDLLPPFQCTVYTDNVCL
jgi:hypothetical protein